jgi:hypothetical protein
MIVKSAGSGGEFIRPKMRIAGTDYAGSTATINTSYSDSRQIIPQSPATSSAWTTTEIDAAEFGIEVQ